MELHDAPNPLAVVADTVGAVHHRPHAAIAVGRHDLRERHQVLHPHADGGDDRSDGYPAVEHAAVSPTATDSDPKRLVADLTLDNQYLDRAAVSPQVVTI